MQSQGVMHPHKQNNQEIKEKGSLEGKVDCLVFEAFLSWNLANVVIWSGTQEIDGAPKSPRRIAWRVLGWVLATEI